MKNIILILGLIISICSCSSGDKSSYQTQWSQGGKDSVVYVHYVDNNGNSNNFFYELPYFSHDV